LTADPAPTEQRIVESARHCFEATGIDRTRMDDIAAGAGVSRQTVYKYFASKADIADRLAHLEMVKVNASLRRRIRPDQPFADRLAEAILLSVEISRQNPWLMRTVTDVRLMPRYSDRSGDMFQWQKLQWSGMIERARRAGDLAADLDIDQVVHWILLSQLMLLLTFERLPLGDAAARAFVRRFMVEPLVAGGAAEAELAIQRAENAALRDLVATQALALQARETERTTS
jgi:AcrR family transcriptional regulator